MLRVRERAFQWAVLALPPPPLSHQEVINAIKVVLFYNYLY